VSHRDFLSARIALSPYGGDRSHRLSSSHGPVEYDERPPDLLLSLAGLDGEGIPTPTTE
jgi:hypothetical protein